MAGKSSKRKRYVGDGLPAPNPFACLGVLALLGVSAGLICGLILRLSGG